MSTHVCRASGAASLIALCTALLAATSSYAASAYHSCGKAPETPGLFDPRTADENELVNIKTEFDAYSLANTTYIDCLKSAYVSDEVQSLRRRKKKRAIADLEKEVQATDAREDAFANDFNILAQEWAKLRKAKSR